MTAIARRVYLNPADKQSGYVLWGNGYIEPFGYALPVEQEEGSVNNWPSQKAPTFYIPLANDNPAIALSIIDWNTPAGYTLTIYGHVWAWGGVATVPGGASAPLTDQPEFYLGVNPPGTTGGFSSTQLGYVNDFVMDPAGNGRGYMLWYNGDVRAFGTGVTAVTHAGFISDTWAMDLEMDWSSKRYWILDNKGRIWGRNGGNDVGYDGQAAGTYVWGREGHGLKLYDKSATPLGHMIDRFGRIHRVGAAPDVYGAPFNVFYPMSIWRDFEYVDDGTTGNPRRIVPLSTLGERPEFVTHTAPRNPISRPVNGATITSTSRPYISWTYIDAEGDRQDSWRLEIYNSTTYLAGGTNEVQRITITGSPTGGTYTLTLTHKGMTCTTSAIAYNASNATIQSALEALDNVIPGDITMGGGPLPGSFATVTFTGTMAAYDVQQMTATAAFTGGTTPAIAITTTTAGVGISPGSTPGSSYTTFVQVPGDLTNFRLIADLPNATYRAYVLTVDETGLFDINPAWSNYTQFTLNVTVLNVPTVTPTVVGGLGGVSLRINAATGAGLPGTARFCVQYHDPDWDGTNWYDLPNGDALVPDGSGVATVVDSGARFGVLRSYRAITYVYDSNSDDFNGSLWSTTATATLSPRNVWALRNTANTDAVVVRCDEWRPTRGVAGSVFAPQGREFPIVLNDGVPKAPSFELPIWALNNSDRTVIERILDSGQTLHVRDPFGREEFFRVFPEYSFELVRAQPAAGEVTPIRDAHKYSVKCQSVRRPTAGPALATHPLAEMI